ncbi:Ser-Thr-rich glycosyl-phosphatidyl-inositol-anchored membrane family-domain-containing protein [Xylariomycetidae sp. FL0641]|nr:Ser-Thr-rich glycosyl-phosphatidyl-inositol-anchored membrane family-domain-containing protein [Xylariomycetidae sp. FL0641]
MRYTVSAVLAFAVQALAQTPGYGVMTSPTSGAVVQSGKTFTVVWQPNGYTGQAVLSLVGGATQGTLMPLSDLATINIEAGSFSWNVDCSLGEDNTYGLKITSTANPATFQWSFPFKISAPSCGATTAAVSTTSSSSSILSSSMTTPAVTTTEAVSSEAVSVPASSSTPCDVYTTSSAETIVISSPTGYFSTMTMPIRNGTTTANGQVPTAPTVPVSVPTAGSNVTYTTGTVAPTSTPPIVVGAASKAGAGTLALVGGLAAAFFAW